MVGFPPKSSILIGFSNIFTIHFGVPLFLETPLYEIIPKINGGGCGLPLIYPETTRFLFIAHMGFFGVCFI